MSEFEIPWAIDNARHTARLFRRQAQKETGSGSGVDFPGDLKVQALNQPGPGFRVAPGGAMVQSRDSSAAARESYGPVLSVEKTVSGVPGTGSGQTRRDMVILEITDPEMESKAYPKPIDPPGTGGWLDGDNFCRITIIPDVDSLVAPALRPVKRLSQITSGEYANVTGLELAAINWPASTAAISNAMIEDLRRVHRPEVVSGRVGSNTQPTTQDLTASSFARWISNGTWTLDVPDGATFVDIRLDVLNAIHMQGNVYGVIGCFVDGVLAASGPYAADWAGAQTRQTATAWGRYRIPPEKVGKPVVFDLRAYRSITTGYLRADAQTRAVLDYRFIGEAV